MQLPTLAVDHEGAVLARERHSVGALEGPKLDADGMFPSQQKIVELVDGGHRVRGFLGVLGIGELAAACDHAARRFRVHGPERDVDEVNAPVGHQPAGVVPEPPEPSMEPVAVERPLRCRAEPAVVVHARRRLPVRQHRQRGEPVHVRPGAHAADAPEGTAAHELHGLGPVRAAALPLAALHHPPVAAGGGGHRLALADRVGQRLFHVHVLAGGAGIDHLDAVPMVGRADDHRVDVVVVEQRPVVRIQRRRPAAKRFEVASAPFEHTPIDVAERGALDPRLPQQRLHIGEPRAIDADGPNHDAVARRHRLPTLGKRRPQRRTRRPSGRATKKAAPRQAHGYTIAKSWPRAEDGGNRVASRSTTASPTPRTFASTRKGQPPRPS